jgi:hypothetical protein
LSERSYKDISDVLAVVSAFENATISRDDWRHAEHLVVALWYLDKHDEKVALDKVRSGILNLLTSGFQVDLSKEMPYHETMTVFWVRAVAEFNDTRKEMPLAERASELVNTFDKEYPMKFYSRKLLFSDDARAAYVEPDLRSIDEAAAT